MKIITNSKGSTTYTFIGGDSSPNSVAILEKDGKEITIRRGDTLEVEDFILPCKLGPSTQSHHFECPGCAKIVGADRPRCFKYSYRYGLAKVITGSL